MIDPSPLDCDLSVPLVLDLDGTLLATDTLHEALFLFIKREARNAWKLPLWLMSGRAAIKQRLGHILEDEDVERLPINHALEAFARREADLGRQVILATAADQKIADKIAKRFGFISKTIASDGVSNLKGKEKARQLIELYPNGFIYAGDSKSDIHVWDQSSGAIVVGGAPLFDRAAATTDVHASFEARGFKFNTLRRGLRLHQWAKNALIFVPIILGGKALDVTAWTQGLMAFVALSLLASATYIFNDLLDLQEDRAHWSKKNRPIASGEFSIAFSVGLAALLGLTSITLAAILGWNTILALSLYLVISLGYSINLKREPIIDVFLLATLFTMRIAIGNIVTGIAFSPWLMVFSMSVFLSLSLAKRYTEITRMIEHGHEKTRGRGYIAGDAAFILSMGVASMIAAILIMIIYLIEDAFPKGFYANPDALWGVVAIIFLWLARVWLLCSRGELHDDPVAFALKDRLSLCYATAMGIIFVIALL